MKRIFTLLFLLISISINAQYWTPKNTCLDVRGINSSSAFVVNSKAYVLNGSLFEYDAVTDTWLPKSTMPITIVDEAIGFTIGNKGYICFGIDTFISQQLWEYDPISNLWQQKANFPGNGLRFPFSFSIGSDAYIGCGGDSFLNPLSDVWKYNQITDTWLQVASFPHAAMFLSGANYGGKGLVSYPNSVLNITEMWMYDTLTNAWTQKSSCPHFMMNNECFIIGDNIYVGMGYAPPWLTDFWSYNITTDSWQQIPSFPGNGRMLPLSFTIGNKGYIGFGDDGFPYYDLYEYTPDSTTSINSINKNDLILVTPNPFTISLTVTLNNNQPATITIYDITSRKLLQQQFTNTVTLNTSQLATGIFIYTITNNNGVIKNGKVVRE